MNVARFLAGDSPKTEAILELLQNPATYDEKLQGVESVETHISWVFLTDRFVYKLKKPVRFDFLDFSTPQLRHAACVEEVRLNRQLAPHVYLGVVPITMGHRKLHLGGEGSPVDWVVKMNRLPADRALDELIRGSKVTSDEVHRIGHTLSKFYDQLPPLTIRPDEYRREIEDHVRNNRHELLDVSHGLNSVSVRRVHQGQLQFLTLSPELLDGRVLDGRIVEGHGDLRPEHIYLDPFPTIIDCVEFNTEFRQLDVLDELAFLTMECATLGAQWVGEDVIKQYCNTNNDDPRAELLLFYQSYRACVRAKVSALRAEQLTGRKRLESLNAAERYLRLADTYRQRSGPPLLLVVRGLTGTGKSTIAAALAESLGIEHLQTDAIRRELFGKSKQPAEYGEDIYQPQHRARVYDELLRQSEAQLNDGLSVVLDGTFLTAKSRADAVAIARSNHAVPLLVHCHCPNEVARQRIADRIETGPSLSESHPDIHVIQKYDEEPDPAGLPVCHVDTASAQQEVIATIVARLKTLYN